MTPNNYLCMRCGTDWTGAPGHPKSFCDEIRARSERDSYQLALREIAGFPPLSNGQMTKIAEDALHKYKERPSDVR